MSPSARIFKFTLFFHLLLFPLVLVGQEVEREWVDKSGKFKLQATFKKLENGQVFLKRADDATIKIPLTSLSVADRGYVEKITAPKPPEKNSEEVSPPTEKVEPETDPPSATENSSMDETKPKANTTPDISTKPDAPAIERSQDNPSPKSTVSPKNLTRKASPTPALEIKPPGSNFQFLDEDKLEFQSKVDPAAIAALSAALKGPATQLLKRPNVVKVAQAFFDLSQQDSVAPVVIELLKETLQSKNKYYRIQSLKLLAIHAPNDSIDLILAKLDDPSYDVRSKAMDCVEYLKAPEAVEQLIEMFPGKDRNKIVTVLTNYGSSVEENVFPLLNHQNRTVVADAVRVLGFIGTEKSLAKLAPLLEEKVVIRMQAKASIDKIKSRIQN